MVQPDGPQIKI